MASPLLKSNIKRAGGLLAALLTGSIIAQPVLAGDATTTTTTTDAPAEPSMLTKWWDGKYATSDWFGVRNTLEDHGLKLTGMWKGFFYGMVGGGLKQQGAFDEEIKFMGELDFSKLLNAPELQGLTANAKVRWRDGRNPNTYVGANSAFGPSDIQSGQQWRFDYAYLSYTTPELFGVKNFLTVSGGWQNPYDFFLDVPLENLFVNNTFSGTRGLSNIPWSSSYGAWGGYVKVKPNSWWYAMGGLYMAVPNATALSNHGLYFQGYAPDPSANGLFYIGETGFTPKWGPDELPGKYAFGGYYFGVDKTPFTGDTTGQYGFYIQVDQMLYRAKSHVEEAPTSSLSKDGKSVADGKSFSEPVGQKPVLSDKGLSFFSMFSYAPSYNNLIPFYFTTGLVYKGLIPTRDADQLMFAFAYGQYSIDNIDNLQDDGVVNQPNYSSVLEWDYRIQFNKWAYAQPFCQYIIQPSGAGNVANATVLGVAMGLSF
jgi:porin